MIYTRTIVIYSLVDELLVKWERIQENTDQIAFQESWWFVYSGIAALFEVS